jgi:hypothetical protein
MHLEFAPFQLSTLTFRAICEVCEICEHADEKWRQYHGNDSNQRAQSALSITFTSAFSKNPLSRLVANDVVARGDGQMLF